MNNINISAGSHLTSPSDLLKKMPIEHLFQSLRSPNDDIKTQINNLRIVRSLDRKRYAELKKGLPYIVCASFNPPYRRTENFAYTETFIMDIDNVSSQSMSIEELRKEISSDSRVMLLFSSPGGDGLKVMFRLSERCYDSGVYSIFYKEFVNVFAEKYNLQHVIDSKTSDVCRACFISVDPEAYYNPECDAVAVKDYIDVDNPLQMFDMKHEQQMEEESSSAEEEPVDIEPDDDSLSRIREILKLKTKKRQNEEKIVYVPEELNQIIDSLTEYINDNGIEVTEVISISYGKKIRMRVNQKQSEVNVFYGRRGFTVVVSPRSGTNSELNELSAQLIETFFQ